MNLQQLLLKIERMYAAVGSATEPDLSKFPPTFDVAEQSVMVRQDFNQGLDRAQLENKAFQVIRSIADMKDHLRAAARRVGRDPDEVEQAIEASLPLQLVIDLANFDKHGAHEKPPKQRSKRSPRLVNVRGAFQITAKAGDIGSNGAFGFRQTLQGVQPFGGGKASVVITGEIVDASDQAIMVLEFAQASAIEAWEALLTTSASPAVQLWPPARVGLRMGILVRRRTANLWIAIGSQLDSFSLAFDFVWI